MLTLALVPEDRATLHQRIAQRFAAMLDGGLVEEVINLREKYTLNAELPSMRCVGYRQVWEFLEGQLPQKELYERGLFATRQLAKRQLTWLRSMEYLTRIDPLAGDPLPAVLDEVRRWID
jgi:tRNA dimethylallyltransferase